MEWNDTIGILLKDKRVSIGLTQKLVAEFLDCDQSFISKFETGERNIKAEYLEKMLTLYGCALQDIFASNCSQRFNMAFRASSVTDLKVIHDINNIAINNRFVSHLLKESLCQEVSKNTKS